MKTTTKENWKKKNFVGLEGGSDGTYYKVVEQHGGIHTDYPAMIDGVEVGHSHFMENCKTEKEYNESIKKYFAAKIKREREAVILTVVGNPISLESDLNDIGYDCFAVSPHTVDIYGYNPIVNLVKIGAKGGQSKSAAKQASSRKNGKLGGRPKVKK